MFRALAWEAMRCSYELSETPDQVRHLSLSHFLDRLHHCHGFLLFIRDHDSFMDVLSRISACIDFSFHFWCLQGIVGRRSSAFNEAGGRSGDRCRIKERDLVHSTAYGE